MKRIVKITLLSLAVLAGILILARLAGWLQWYEAPTMANYPALRSGRHLLATNLRTPHRGDFILYKSHYDGDPGRAPGGIFVHRLVARGGDELELVRGDLYVNGRNVDSARNLMHLYRLTEVKAAPYLADLPEDYEAQVHRLDGGLVELPMETRKAGDAGLFASRAAMTPDFFDEYISRVWQMPWNRDNMGPFTVPRGKLFVLGDNRENSFDSRYGGFVDAKDVVGVVL